MSSYSDSESLINNFNNDVTASVDDIINEIISDAVSIEWYTLDKAGVWAISRNKNYLKMPPTPLTNMSDHTKLFPKKEMQH